MHRRDPQRLLHVDSRGRVGFLGAGTQESSFHHQGRACATGVRALAGRGRAHLLDVGRRQAFGIGETLLNPSPQRERKTLPRRAPSIKRVKDFDEGLAIMSGNRFANGSCIEITSGRHARKVRAAYRRRDDGRQWLRSRATGTERRRACAKPSAPSASSCTSYPCSRPIRELSFPDGPNNLPVRPRREFSWKRLESLAFSGPVFPESAGAREIRCIFPCWQGKAPSNPAFNWPSLRWPERRRR